MQMALQVIQTLAPTPTAWRFPPTCDIKNGSVYDFIIVGGGSTGCVIANRLVNSNYSVLLLEAGGYPPLESELPGWFTLLAGSTYDYNLTSQNDGKTAQNLQGQVVSLVQGKMLGGSSGLQHLMHTQGDPQDYNDWAKMLNDPDWTYENVQPFYKKMETLFDEEILNSAKAKLHGTDGFLRIARERHAELAPYLSAFEELGHKVEIDTTSDTSALGYGEPLFEIANEIRQSSAHAYLTPIKSRKNLCLSLFSTATKILIENNEAVGVQVTKNGKSFEVYAKKEVVVTAGALNTPKLLMLSGVGPTEHLQSFDIEVVSDLPVGQNLQDHACAGVLYQMDESSAVPAPTNPHEFPAPSFNGYVSLNSSKPYADYETINLTFDPESGDLLQLCVNMFKYSLDVCQAIYEASIGRKTMFTLLGLVMPVSRGQVLLASSNPADNPIVITGTFSNNSDIELIGKAFMDHNRVLNTTYFRSVNATLFDAGLCQNAISDADFWECYAVEMSATMWHYTGTCAMGKVLDSRMRVKGVESLRVGDASAMPTLIRGKIFAAVMMVAERCADFILKDWN